jgi:hypothetical protein
MLLKKKEKKEKLGEPSPIRGNTFSHLSLEDFKETFIFFFIAYKNY